jgi:hypothetical protein
MSGHVSLRSAVIDGWPQAIIRYTKAAMLAARATWRPYGLRFLAALGHALARRPIGTPAGPAGRPACAPDARRMPGDAR